MCLSRDSLIRYLESNSDITQIIPVQEYHEANRIFQVIWDRLDHTRHYCINPGILALELLTRTGKHYSNSPLGIDRFKSQSRKSHYKETIDHMWSLYP